MSEPFVVYMDMREFRQELTEAVEMVKQGKVIRVESYKRPTAYLVGVEMLERLLPALRPSGTLE